MAGRNHNPRLSFAPMDIGGDLGLNKATGAVTRAIYPRLYAMFGATEDWVGNLGLGLTWEATESPSRQPADIPKMQDIVRASKRARIKEPLLVYVYRALLKAVPRFVEICSCSCLLLRSGFACSIHET